MADPYAGIAAAVTNAPSGGGGADPYSGIAAPTSPSGDGLRANFIAGAEQGLTGLGDALQYIPGLNEASLIQPVTGHTAQYWLDKGVGAVTGKNPEDVKAATPGERIIRQVGAGVSSALLPTGEAMTVGNLIKSGLIGAGAGAAGGVASEVAPTPLKPLAQVAGTLAGGVGTARAMDATGTAGAAVRGAGDVAASGFSAPAAEQVAGRTLNARAAAPKTVADMLSGGSDQIVPGSEPTTFQQTGDVGLGALEREQAAKNPAAFATRRGDQNAARVSALADVQSGGDPASLSAALKSHFEDLDAQTQAHVDALTEQLHAAQAARTGAAEGKAAAAQTGAQAAAEGVGGTGVPEGYGEQVRSAIQEAETAARARESGLWKAVDPNGDLTGNVSQTVSTAKEIAADIPKTAKPMSGEEAGIFDAATEMPSLAPVSDLIALRSRVSTEMRNELIANGRSATYARLSHLRGAIQSNLADTISLAAANDQSAISRGALAPEEAIAAKVQGWANDYRNQQEQAGGGGAQSDRGVAPGGATVRPESDGTGLPPAGGPGGPAGDQGLPGSTPTFDEDAAARLAAATSATKERAGTFNLGPTGQVLRKAGDSQTFRLPESRVPEKFFHPGPSGYQDMQALFRAVGQPKGLEIIQDYAANSLRRAAMREDGTLDPVKYARWAQAHADALRALPDGIRTKFGAAAEAGAQAIDKTKMALAEKTAAAKDAERGIVDLQRARAVQMKAASSGAVGKLMGLTHAEDVRDVVGALLNSKNAVGEMENLANAAKADPEAYVGLRQAIADHIVNRYISNTEAGASGQNLIKADAFQTFLKSKRAALGQVFTNGEMDTMQAVARDINRAKRSENAIRLPGGSNTAQDLAGIVRNGRGIGRPVRSVLDAIGAGVGALHGPVGAVAGYLGVHAVQALRQAGIDRVDELLTDALLNPAVARQLMLGVRRDPKGFGLAAAIRQSALATGTVSGATVH